MPTLNTIVDTLNKYYSDNDIYKSLIICDCDTAVNNLAMCMEAELFTVCKLTETDVLYNDAYDFDPDAEMYKLTMASSEKLKNFNSIDYRVIIISYDIWNIVKNEIETYVLPEQNLIVLNITNKICVTNVYDWIIDTLNRGFITRPSSYIMNIDNDISYVYNLIDRNHCKNNIALSDSYMMDENAVSSYVF